jgi:hypothetical protein
MTIHTSLFLTPVGRHAGEITPGPSSRAIVVASVTVCSPNLSLIISTGPNWTPLTKKSKEAASNLL